MCGIAGVFRLAGRPVVEDAVAVLRMLDAQVHRGPDDWGLLLPDSATAPAGFRSLLRGLDPEHVRTYPDHGTSRGVILGSRRLSILDLSPRGRMPMGSVDGRRWITHNGEIYNHRELRHELSRGGASFRSDTDTEVILRGSEAWGDEVVPRLRGMFAFALFDAEPRPRLLLARDRFGIKPVYYYQDRERLIFASEVRALLRSGLVPDESNPEALLRFLQLGSVPAPLTTIKEVCALPAGHCLVVDADGGALRACWNPAGHFPQASARPESVSLHEAVSSTRALLEESARLHLISDVPLGVFLSGGIDSSALVALASRFRDAPLTTLSVAFEEPAYDEARYARLVAERYCTDHREILLRAQEFFDAIPEIFSAMDEPTVDGVNTYLVSRAARRAGLTVVLSGMGADEVFLGYGHLRRSASLDRARRLLALVPVGTRRALLRCAEAGGTAMGRVGFEKLEYLESPSAANMYVTVRGLFSPRQIRSLLGISPAEYDAYGPALPGGGGPGRWQPVDGLGMLEFAHYLQNQLLKDTDVMSMACSVETRVPYLDHPLVEYVLALPTRIRLAGSAPKPLLLEALGDALPRQVWDRPKMGFTFPFATWLRRRSEELRALSLERKLLQPRAVEDVWSRFNEGRLHWSRAWALAVLARFDVGRREDAA